jgi:hypothetical protein
VRHRTFDRVEVTIGISGIDWLRAGVKMTLATLSLSQPDACLDTKDARTLLGWLWES